MAVTTERQPRTLDEAADEVIYLWGQIGGALAHGLAGAAERDAAKIGTIVDRFPTVRDHIWARGAGS